MTQLSPTRLRTRNRPGDAAPPAGLKPSSAPARRSSTAPSAWVEAALRGWPRERHRGAGRRAQAATWSAICWWCCAQLRTQPIVVTRHSVSITFLPSQPASPAKSFPCVLTRRCGRRSGIQRLMSCAAPTPSRCCCEEALGGGASPASALQTASAQVRRFTGRGTLPVTIAAIRYCAALVNDLRHSLFEMANGEHADQEPGGDHRPLRSRPTHERAGGFRASPLACSGWKDVHQGWHRQRDFSNPDGHVFRSVQQGSHGFAAASALRRRWFPWMPRWANSGRFDIVALHLGRHLTCDELPPTPPASPAFPDRLATKRARWRAVTTRC